MKNILIVEDEAHLADGLKFNLEAEGYSAEIAGDGAVALERLAASAFDAVVLDVMLPEIDGFDVAKTMRERADYTPILMLTARGRPEDVLLGFEAGTDDYLAKPFDLDIFLARLNGLLRRRQWIRDGPKTCKPNGRRHYQRTIDRFRQSRAKNERRTRPSNIDGSKAAALLDRE